MSEAKRATKWRSPVFYPFLFAIYPILFLVAHNLEQQVGVRDALGPLAVTLAATATGFGITWAVFRDAHKAGILTSLLVVLFFSLGPVAGGLRSAGIEVDDFTLLYGLGALGIGGIFLIARTHRPLERTANWLNLIAGALVLLNLIPIVSYEANAGDHVDAGVTSDGTDALTGPAERDIYYLIFDRYANQETLKELFDFDNRGMLHSLEDRGFYVAPESVANYPKTAHSLASSLNLSYLNHLSKEGPAQGDYGALYALLEDTRVARNLKSIGYPYYHLGSWWNGTERDPSADVNFVFSALSQFSELVLSTTAWKPISDRFGLEDSARYDKYRRVLYQFDTLEGISEVDGPTFTFAHILLPHPPYIFDRDGNFLTSERAKSPAQNYVEQLMYTNKRIIELLDALLSGPSETDPIVIIQSDEGPHPDQLERYPDTYDWTKASDQDLAEKMRLLNAYYLPGATYRELYPSISPVNTFRVVFNTYFDAHLPILEDRSWVYKDRRNLYTFTEVTKRLHK